jgi:hypothetical protein
VARRSNRPQQLQGGLIVVVDLLLALVALGCVVLGLIGTNFPHDWKRAEVIK